MDRLTDERRGGREAPISLVMTLCGYALVLGSFLTYSQSGLPPIAILGYALALGALFLGFVAARGLSKVIAQRVVVFSFLLAFVTFISAFYGGRGALNIFRLAQELLYPITAGLLLVVGYRILQNAHRSLGWLIVFLAGANFAVGVAGVAGFLSSAGPFGDVFQGRFIFGTELRSSNGLAFNVNYYATTQAALGFLYALFRSVKQKKLTRVDWMVVGLILVSSLIGSSRGVTVGILTGIAFLIVINALRSKRSSKAQARVAIVLVGVLVTFAVGLYWDEIREIFRFDRGLNARDEIWAVVLLAWMERPWFGWGIETGWAMGWVSAGEFEGTSAHSGYLHTLLRIGGVGALVVYGGLAYFLWWSFKGNLTAMSENQVAWACVLVYLANAIFRSYSFGGVGLLPLVAALGISVLLYRRRQGGEGNVSGTSLRR